MSMLRASAGLLIFCMISPVYAHSISELMTLAIKGGEPTYEGAAAGLRAAQARNRQALGALLPQINASANTNANRRGYETRNLNFVEERDRYNSHAWQLNLTQPLWRYAAIADKRQASALMGQAEFQWEATEQSLFSKLVEAWLDVLAARDNHNFTLSQERAAQRQLDMVNRGSQLGTHGMPQREEAYAKYLQAQTERLMAVADFEVKRAALEQLTGTLDTLDLPTLQDNPTQPEKGTGSLQQWLDMVIAINPDIAAANKAWEAAHDDVSQQIAGYMPSVDLVGNYGKNSQAVGGFPGQNGYDIRQSYVGLQANWSLFTSGAQSSKVREARAMMDKAKYSLESARRTAINNTKQSWYSFQVAQAKSKAATQAILAAQLALKVARIGTDSGVKAELDILQAQQQLAAANKDFAKSYYDQITAIIKLKALAGIITMDDLAVIDALFNQSPITPIYSITAKPVGSISTMDVQP
jgi:outer membrane protein